MGLGIVTLKLKLRQKACPVVVCFDTLNCYLNDCNIVYRYLYLRWGMDLSKLVVFVGESGDTDYEGLIGGLRKAVIMKGLCTNASSLIHGNRSYPLSDVLPFDSPNVIQADEECSSTEIRSLLEKLGVLKG